LQILFNQICQPANSTSNQRCASAGWCCVGSAVSPRLAFWPLPHRPQTQPCVQSIWAWLGHWSTINGRSCGAWSIMGEEGLTTIKRVRQHYSICSLCSAGELAERRAWVNNPRPRIFRREPSIRRRCKKLADKSACICTSLFL